MDYFFLSSLNQNTPIRLAVSYDIACQWSKNIKSRVDEYPVTFSLLHHLISYFIPKWHILAHRSECQQNFSFNYSPHVGRTDGEAPERGWAAQDGVANSTKGMGPGSRSDTLDDHFGDFNWRKIVNMGEFPSLLLPTSTHHPPSFHTSSQDKRGCSSPRKTCHRVPRVLDIHQ